MECLVYLDDMHAFYKQMEWHAVLSPDYVSECTLGLDQGLRAFTIEWLLMAQDELGYWDEVLYDTISIMDRFLSSRRDEPQPIMLTALGALHIALKYHELGTCLKRLVSLAAATAGYICVPNNIIHMEKSILTTLKYQVWVPTPLSFMPKLLRDARFDKESEVMCGYLLHICLTEPILLGFPPSVVAMAAIYTVQCTFIRLLNKNVTHLLSGYCPRQIRQCSKLMLELHDKDVAIRNEMMLMRMAQKSIGDVSINDPKPIVAPRVLAA